MSRTKIRYRQAGANFLRIILFLSFSDHLTRGPGNVAGRIEERLCGPGGPSAGSRTGSGPGNVAGSIIEDELRTRAIATMGAAGLEIGVSGRLRLEKKVLDSLPAGAITSLFVFCSIRIVNESLDLGCLPIISRM